LFKRILFFTEVITSINKIEDRELIRFFISLPPKDYLKSNKLILIVTILLKAFLIKVSLYFYKGLRITSSRTSLSPIIIL